MGLPIKFPREVIKHAFQAELIENGELWLEMLEKQNELTCIYDKIQTKNAARYNMQSLLSRSSSSL